MKGIYLLTCLVVCFVAGCTSNNIKPKPNSLTTGVSDTGSAILFKEDPLLKKVAEPATILKRKEVPVLCYHHIRPIKPGTSVRMKSYSVTPAAFAAQLQILADSGYQTVLPDQLYDYLAFGTPLPGKPFMITFDDTNEEQYTIGAAEMKKHGFRGVFFIMTISINKPRYMSKAQIKTLADDGNVIACHTWDHHKVTKYSDEDWDKQVIEPRNLLEDITGKPVTYFAYPFGLWNKAAITQLQKRDYRLAFILSTQRDTIHPLHTVRRMIVPGTWSSTGMLKAMKATFN